MASDSTADNKTFQHQFYGQIDKQTYREFRVSSLDLAELSVTKTTNGALAVGLKRVVESHNSRIAELENEIRHHQQMKKAWTQMEKATNEKSGKLVARILESSPQVIEIFEKENFGPNCSWSKPIKTNNAYEMKSVLSSVKRLDGTEIKKEEKVKNEETTTPTTQTTTLYNTSENGKKQTDRKKNYAEVVSLKTNGEVKTKKSMGKQVTSDKNGTVKEKNEMTPEESIAELASCQVFNELKLSTEKKEAENVQSAPEQCQSTESSKNTGRMDSSMDSVEIDIPDYSSPDTLSNPSLSVTGTSSSQSGSSSTSSGNRKANSHRKGKKAKKGPKITLEEIEAIRKRKKEEADRAYEKKQREMQEHFDKIQISERHKCHRKVAETALEMMRTGNKVLPPEIQELNHEMNVFVESKKPTEKYELRDLYLQTRVEEITRTLIGQELASKMELMAVYEDVIERSGRLQVYLMFLSTLEEIPGDFTDFELRVIQFYLKGYEEDNDIDNQRIEENFKKFESEFISQIPETERWSFSKEFVEGRLQVMNSTKDEKPQDDAFLEEAYCGIADILEVFSQCTNVLAFLQASKQSPSFNLMEAWFLESRRPPPLENDSKFKFV